MSASRRSMRRILVIGPGGAGKTTLARALGGILGLPVVHLDALYWRPGWRPTAPEAWRRTVQEATAAPAWIMDGNYGGTMETRMAAADTLIFLDLPRSTCLARVLLRRLRYAGRSRPSMTVGCPERVTVEFLRWIWTYPTRRRPGVLALLERFEAGRQVVVLRSRREVETYLRRVAGADGVAVVPPSG